MSTTRFAITSYALANAMGGATREVLHGVFEGRTSLRPPSAAFPMPFTTVVGEMPLPPPLPSSLAPYDTRITRIAWQAVSQIEGAVREAVERVGAARVGLVIGTCTGGLEHTERAHVALRQQHSQVTYRFDDHHAIDNVAHVLARALGIRGPATTVSTACSSSSKAIAIARRMLASNLVDAVLVGGVDTLCFTTMRGFHSLGVLSERATRPFAHDRDGLSLSEGAGFILLERAPVAAAAFVAGIGESSDAHHLSGPHPQGAGAQRAMRDALVGATSAERDVAYVSAHGTGTPQNDAAEGRAIAEVFASSTKVTSNKSLLGHQLGAAGITAIIVAAESLQRRMIPPTLIGDSTPDPSIPIQLVTTPEQFSANSVLVNSFAFGGSNVCVLLTTS